MFLSKFIILNNKSCKNINLAQSKTEPEVLIGINDCGKSTILKSLDVFFDEKKSLNFLREDQQKSDFSNSPLNEEEFNQILSDNIYPSFQKYSGNIIGILCEFELEEADKTDADFQDSAKNTHLKWAIGDSDKIAILRIFHDYSDGSQNLTGYYLLTDDYKKDENFIEAWSKTKDGLKKIRKDLDVKDEDVTNENGKGPFKNIEEIRAIYKKVETELKPSWFLYKDFSKDKTFFPSFKYLDWNFSLKDLEDMATEAMNEVTSPLLGEIKSLASTKQAEAIVGVNKKFEELMGDLKDELPTSIKKISSSVFFNVNQKITDIKLTKENVDGEVHIDNQGDGIKRQIWFALLKWRSKLPTSAIKRNKYIWCFDEPETHLYPSAQRQLFSTFRDMCEKEFQVLLSTHSTVFIDRTRINNINKVILNNGYSVINKTDSIDDIFDCLGLQNSDFLFFDKFLAVEGPTEYELIPKLYKLKFGKTLIEDGIQLINLKGKSQCKNHKQILEDILSKFQKTDDKIYYLFDADTEIASGTNVCAVGINDIEDSIPNNIWIKFVKDNCDIDLTTQIIDDEIRAKLTREPQKKFYKLLRDYVASNVVDDKYLPSKGSDSGSILAGYFISKEEIPESIGAFFDCINS
ncbi:MAG: AAA family ATPase [Candidatus Doudnabacteria bacterium]